MGDVMAYAAVREAIYDHLVDNVESVGERVFAGWNAADAEMPYLVLEFTGEVPLFNTRRGRLMEFAVFCVGSKDDKIFGLDPVADEVEAVFEELVDGQIRCKYQRESRGDSWSEQLQANIIRLKFAFRA
jgi:hypothetical protein